MKSFGSIRLLSSLLVRQNFSPDCETAINKQINMELKASQHYLAMAYQFDRSDVALPNVFKFFKASSDEERQHASLLMQYMNKRGGQIVLSEIPAPTKRFTSVKEAMVEAFEMEKSVNQSILDLHALASKQNDPSLADFLDTHFVQEQVDAQKQLADLIRQVERSEKELGCFMFDINLKDGMHGEGNGGGKQK